MPKEERRSVSDWLVAHCNLNEEKAEELEKRLSKECFVDSVGSLRQCASHTPDVLDKLHLPHTLLLNLHDRLGILNAKTLSELTVSEVRIVLANIFQDIPEYSAIFFRLRISGFVLSRITTCNELIDWGIKTKDHALALLGHISSWKASGVPKHYLRVCDKRITEAEVIPQMVPRKRGRDENVAPRNVVLSGRSAAVPELQSSNDVPAFSVTAHMPLLDSADEKVRLQGLEKLQKRAERDRSIVDMFVHTGLIDKLLLLRKDPVEEVVFKVLSLLDLIVQKGDEGTLRYLVDEKKLVAALGPKLWTVSHRVRMNIVRIVTSIAHTPQASTLLQDAVLQGIVSMYFTAVTGVKARDAEETRHRTARALKTMCRAADQPHHLAVLLHSLPLLRDILEIDRSQLITIPAACSVLRHIMYLSAGKIHPKRGRAALGEESSSSSCDIAPCTSAGSTSPSATSGVPDEILHRILPILATRLTDKKSEIAVSVLSMLMVFCECCRADQLNSLGGALQCLPKLCRPSAAEEMRLAVAMFLLPLCRRGRAVVDMLVEADVFPAILELVLAGGDANMEEDGEGGDTDVLAAEGFLAAASSTGDAQLTHFLRINIYSALLQMVLLFAYRPRAEAVLLQVLVLLRDLILKVEGIDQEQLTPAEEQREVDAWVIVQKLAAGVGRTGNGASRAAASTERVEVREAAGALIKSACVLGILEAAKPA